MCCCRYVAAQQRIAAALQQDPGHPCSFPDLVALLFALQSGLLDHVPAQHTATYIDAALQHVRQHAQAALDEVAASKQLTAAAEKGITDALEAYRQQWQKQQPGAGAAAAAAPATASA
jgi:F0F1-type ATP synthase alpha subunit